MSNELTVYGGCQQFGAVYLSDTMQEIGEPITVRGAQEAVEKAPVEAIAFYLFYWYEATLVSPVGEHIILQQPEAHYLPGRYFIGEPTHELKGHIRTRDRRIRYLHPEDTLIETVTQPIQVL